MNAQGDHIALAPAQGRCGDRAIDGGSQAWPTGEIDRRLGAATSWQAKGRLKGGGIVSTVMSNLGLERYLEGAGLGLHRTQVGDRYVVEALRDKGFNVGGEPSGHIVFKDFSTTGDGLIAACQMLAEMVRQGKPASEAFNVFQPVPQVLKNVSFKGQKPLEQDAVKKAIENANKRLDGTGRIIVRESGTEPLVRIMAEGEDKTLIQGIVDELCAAVQKAA